MAHHRDQRPIGSRSLKTEAFGSVPPQHQPRRKVGFLRRVLNLLLLLAALALIGGLGYAVLTWSGVGGSDVPAGTKVQVVVPKNASANDIAGILADTGVIGNETVFRARLKLKGDGADFHSGTYRMKTGASYDSIVRALNTAPVAAPTFDVTIVEGQRLEETAAAIDDKRRASLAEGGTPRPVFTGAEYLAAASKLRPNPAYGAPKGTTSMEGLLFPATYQLKLDATAAEFIAKQQQAFADNIAGIDMTRAKAGNLTTYDVTIIASLIEREAKLDKERPLVAAVIYNRLKAGMTLGIDASNQYSVYEQGSKVFWEPELKQSQLDMDSPYNLRKAMGLPPTPIAEPGLKSLQAAANPAKVDYLYYVAKPSGDGSHTFTKSYDEFLAAG
ncbi:MAG: endolytic transglycosylase MltG [Thermoleophilia bacterium]|nr:endolytic transglycosylase MltG [Thermoleophilia bacterium]